MQCARCGSRAAPKSEWVFPQPSGLPGPYENFDGVWYDALTAAKIEDFRFHDLRHTCASYLASQGASLLEIADVLGPSHHVDGQAIQPPGTGPQDQCFGANGDRTWFVTALRDIPPTVRSDDGNAE